MKIKNFNKKQLCVKILCGERMDFEVQKNNSGGFNGALKFMKKILHNIKVIVA